MAKATEQAVASDDAAAKDAERTAKAEAAQAERDRKAQEREAAKAEKARVAAETKAQRETEAITKILADLPEDKRPTDLDGVDRAKARELVKAYKAEERANRPKKAPLTLSQRRAVLNLADAGKTGIVPKTGFNALPLDHLVGVGLAETFETTKDVVTKVKEGEGDDEKTVERTDQVPATGYRLTDTGRERAGEINPKWKDWKPAPVEETADAS